MRIIIDLHDDLAASYQKEADARTLPLESVIEGRLGAATRLDPRSRYVIVDQPVLGQLETRLGGGHLQDTGDLLDKVSRLAVIKFGEIELPLTPGQYEELAWKAQKQGRTLDQMLQIAYEKFAEDFFTLIPGRR